METHYTARIGQGQSPLAEFVCGTQDRKELPGGQSQERFPGGNLRCDSGHLTVGTHPRF